MGSLEQAIRAVRLAVFDFDGVLTDNAVWIDGDGVESVRCSRADGFGLRRLEEVGVDALIMSKEAAAPVVAARARKLQVGCIQGVGDKPPVVREQAVVRGVALGETAYVGKQARGGSA